MKEHQSLEIPLSVSELVSIIKLQLENDFSELFLEGEISNLTQSSTGHWYFNISDQDASISCCLFRNQTQALKDIYKIKDGEKIKVLGHISVYAKRTAIQVIVKKIILVDSQGDLKKKFEILKNKLSLEGLFDLDKKKKIPDYVTKIAVITAENAAALRDFVTVMKRRSIEYSIKIFPSVMQGDQAPSSLIAALERVEQFSNFDVIVITRGGGSQEDLWCFNDEFFVRKVSQMKIPVISAIGHEVDYTLCDFVADLRCETPTAAAEVLSSKQLKIQENFNLLQKRLAAFGQRKSQFVSYLAESLKPSYMLKQIQNLFLKKRAELTKLEPKSSLLEKRSYRLRVSLEQSIERTAQLTAKNMENKLSKLSHVIAQLNALNPYNVLSRGYTILNDIDGNVITSSKKFDTIEKGHQVNVKFHDGTGVLTKN